MRITKKYSGSSAVGKQTFIPCEPTVLNMEAKVVCEQELNDLRQKFLLALSMFSQVEPSEYTVIADGSGSWMSVDEHTHHFAKKSKIHKSASAPSLNRMGGLGADLQENNLTTDRLPISRMNSDPRRTNSGKTYAMDDAAAGTLLNVFLVKDHELCADVLTRSNLFIYRKFIVRFFRVCTIRDRRTWLWRG
jgi:hypothetical protein